MKRTLVTELALSFADGRTEDFATEALAYLVHQYEGAARALREHLERKGGPQTLAVSGLYEEMPLTVRRLSGNVATVG